MSSDQRSLDDHDDADDAIGSASTDGYSSDAMSESPSTPPSDGQDSNGLRGASGSEPATRLGTPPASSSYPTSDDASMSSSRAPSVYTFDSSVDGQLLREVHGRAYNNTNQAYLLPADDGEQNRLDLQHQSLYLFVGGLFPWPERVEPHLVPSETHRPTIMDIGTGSGTWVLAMGRKYPHADVIGIDLAPPLVDINNIPENCRFEIDDANLSMMHYASSFDFVHMRSADMGIHDFESFLYNVAQVLKPGAEMVLSTGDYHQYDEYRQLITPTEEGRLGFSWFSKYFSAFIDTWRRKNCFLDASFNWERWLRANPNFEDIEVWDMWMPVGPWAPNMTPEHFRASLLFRTNAINMTQSCTAALLDDGYPKDVVEHWQKEAERELLEMRVKLHVKWRWTIFRRTRQPWIPQHQVPPDAMVPDE